MLTDQQIHDLSDRMKIPLAGVYFKDELPLKIEVNKGYIINLQDSKTDDGQENDGTHWTYLQVNKSPNGTIEPIFFDPYGVEPSEVIKKRVKHSFNKYLPYTKKDIQSLMNNACGFYCLALGHFINSSKHRTGHLYYDIDNFLEMFDDLNTSIDWKKNEYILKHFFRSEDPALRTAIDVIKPLESISSEDEKGGKDMTKIEVGVKYMDKK